MPADADSYLHRVGRAGRFGTKGLSISFVSSEDDEKVLKDIEKRFEVALPYVHDVISISPWMRLTMTTVSTPRVVSTRPPTWLNCCRVAGLASSRCSAENSFSQFVIFTGSISNVMAQIARLWLSL